MEREKKLHLLWRSGFGPNLSNSSDIEALSTKQLWDIIKRNSAKELPALHASSSFVQDNYDKITDRRLSREEKAEWSMKIRQQSAKDMRELNTSWVRFMVNSDNQLGEKMSLFWHHHFSIRHANSFLQQDAINIIRKNALGNFGGLLREVSKSGAMILSLNNQQNRKTSPNENFAREIMELFAMGIGHYTETDIKESARAFTGWAIGRDGRFEFKSEYHDTGVKKVLGESGRFDGDDIIDIILKHPQTAVFIASKFYRYFVNEAIDNQRVEQLASSFRKDYDILRLLDAIYNSDWFYEERNIGNRIKSPVELLVGFQRLSPIATIDTRLQNSLQNLLGQVLFHPPSIAGWPMGKHWIDSSTLMVRLQLPQVINGTVAINLRGKSNDDVNMGRNNPNDIINIQNRSQANMSTQWSAWASKISEETLAFYLLASKVDKEKLALLKSKNRAGKNGFAYSLMNLPEYQLC